MDMLETGTLVPLAENGYFASLGIQANFTEEEPLIYRLIEARAQQTPEAFALISPHTHVQVTYRELNQQANRLAHFLRHQGVRPEIPVCICLERSPELIVALLAVMKAGGAYVPLDPSYPTARLLDIIREVQPPVLLTQEHMRPLFASLAGEAPALLCLDSDQDVLAAEPDANPENLVDSENLAYIIYTSGSTGQPKGAQISHRNLSNLVLWKRRTLGQTSLDRESCLAGVAFDAAQWEIWPTLISGGRLYLPEAQVRLSTELLQAWVIEHQITICTTPTQLAEGLLKLTWPAQCSLRYLITGGDRLHLFASADLPFTLVNGYGPTENTIVSTWCVVPAVPLDRSVQMPTIGTAIANVETYILDERYQPVTAGQEGELYLGGKGLSRGYFRRPDWTADRFVPHPFASHSGACLYRTGDVCRYTEDGQIEFVGRSDHQLKIRGFRIELGDIEAALSRHATVKDVLVTAHRKSDENVSLVAYIVPAEGQELVATELRAFLASLLPEYMIPTHFLSLKELPLTPNGKVDRKALPEPAFFEREKDADFVAPRTETERILVDICRDVLNIEHISVHDNIFMLGAYSLLATLIMSRVRTVFQVVLPLVAIFQAPTMAQLAELIEQARRDTLLEQAPVITPVGRETPIPLSFSQERVWFMHYLDPGNTSYHFQATLHFKGDLQVQAVELALNEIVRRHEIFRTTVQEIDGQPMQNIHAFAPFDLTLLDIRDLPAEQREEHFQGLVQHESRRLFDLTRLPLVRWSLVRLDDQDYRLIHVEHHLVHDGWSLNVFLREFISLYQTFVAGESSRLPEPAIQFADFVAWHRQWMQGDVQEQQLRYWKQKLQGASTFLKLPTDYPRPSVQRFKGAAVRLELPGQLYTDLREVGNREGVTLYTVMLAAFCLVMACYSNQDDFCIGSAIANRRWKETEGLLGMLVNNIILRIQLDGAFTWSDLLRHLHTLTMEAYENQDVPFDKLVEALRVERDLSHNPLFQVMFSFHDSAAPQLGLPGLELELLDGINNGSAKFDMNVTAAPRFVQKNGVREPSSITMVWEYNTDLFAPGTIERMTGHFQFLLQELLEKPHLPLSQLSLLTLPERQQLLETWNNTATVLSERCIHELIQEQATLHPADTALIFEGERLTYGELDRRSNQLARYLQQRGVGPDVLVGVCMERSLELVIALVGILKAGGAYLPLDPGYPGERLSYMLKDSGVVALLAQPHVPTLLPEHSLPTICLDRGWSVLDGMCADAVPNYAVPANLAYMIYTSGSTGQPKGAMNTHAALCNRLLWMQEAYQLTKTDRVLQKTPMSFDVSVWEFFWPLITGATLVIARPGGHQESTYLAHLIREQQVTTLHFVPSMLSIFLTEPSLAQCTSLKRVICSGEALPHQLQQEFFKHCSANLYNLYGPTEAAIDVTHWTCEADSTSEFVPIGHPIANIQIYLLDRHLRPVPVGVAGELYIGGVGLSRGYYQRPDLTAERFIPHPFGQDGKRLYKTGDLARFLPDGSIVFLGRIDNQVKLRGFRIELGEIEAVLRKHPAVSETVVAVQTNAEYERHLVAYVVMAQNEPLVVADIRRYLQQHVPDYMVPAFFVPLSALPLTPNGKVDRQALPAIVPQRMEQDVQFVEPSGAIACTLAEMWLQVLGIDQVGIYDNFFHLGGQSLLATRILSRIRQTFQVEVSLRAFFDAPTIDGLATSIAQIMDEQQRTDGWTPTSSSIEVSDLNHRNYQDVLGELGNLSDEEVDKLLDDLSHESLVLQ